MTDRPSPPSDNGNGRDHRGRFTTGNRLGHGSPLAAKAAALRAALLSAIRPEDMVGIARRLVAEALGGNVPAIKELLDRVVGRPVELDVFDRIEQLELLLTKATGNE